jgi:hypothetical protein
MFTVAFWYVLNRYTDEHIAMLADGIEHVVLLAVSPVFGMSALRREDFLELRKVTRSHSLKGIYVDYVVNENSHDRDDIYIGSACGKRALDMSLQWPPQSPRE